MAGKRSARRIAIAAGVGLLGGSLVAAWTVTPAAAGVGCAGFRPITTGFGGSGGFFEGVEAIPRISGDGGTVVFSSDRNFTDDNPEANFEIYAYDVAADALAPVTQSGAGFHSSEPSVSEDGQLVAFSSTSDLGGLNSAHAQQVFLYDRSDSTTERLSTVSGDETTRGPVITEDGSTVFFTSSEANGTENADQNPEVFAHAVATDLTTQVTDTGAEDDFGSVAFAADEDGSDLVFVAARNVASGNPDGGLELWHQSLPAGDPEQITTTPNVEAFGPTRASTTEDGLLTVFESDGDPLGTNADFSSEVFLYDASDDSTTQLTAGDGVFSDSPSISGSGDRVAYVSRADPFGTNADHNAEIFVRTLQTGFTVQLTQTTGGVNAFPSISDNTDRIAFSTTTNLTGTNPDGSIEYVLWHAVGDCPRPDAQIAFSSAGPFKGVGTFGNTATPPQTRAAGVARGGHKDFFVRLVNSGDGRDTLRVRGVDRGARGYTVRYYRGANDITAGVTAGTYVLPNVAADGGVTIKVRITAGNTTVRRSTHRVDLTLRSYGSPTVRDVVRASVQRN